MTTKQLQTRSVLISESLWLRPPAFHFGIGLSALSESQMHQMQFRALLSDKVAFVHGADTKRLASAHGTPRGLDFRRQPMLAAVSLSARYGSRATPPPTFPPLPVHLLL